MMTMTGRPLRHQKQEQEQEQEQEQVLDHE
jgi:hypothetical protein